MRDPGPKDAPSSGPAPIDAGAGAARHVTAAMLVRQFGAVRQQADVAPVFVTQHGRVSHVLCSARHYEGISQDRGQVAPGGAALDMVQLAGLMHDCLLLLDDQCRLVHANHAMLAMTRFAATAIVGVPVLQAFPQLQDTLAQIYLDRVFASGDSVQFEMPCPFRRSGRLACRIAGVGTGIALVMTDIGPEIEALRQRLLQREAIDAIDSTGTVAMVRLSLRGFIISLNDALSAMVGITRERLVGQHFANLVDVRMRSRVAEQMEGAFAQAESRSVAARLLSNHGELIDVTIGLASSCEGLATDGVTLVLTRALTRDSDELRALHVDADRTAVPRLCAG